MYSAKKNIENQNKLRQEADNAEVVFETVKQKNKSVEFALDLGECRLK